MNAESQNRGIALSVRALLCTDLSQHSQEPFASAVLNPGLMSWLEQAEADPRTGDSDAAALRAGIVAARAHRCELAASLYAAESLGLDWELVAVVLGTTADQARLWAQLHHEQRASDDDAGAHITFDLDLSEEAA